MNRSATCGCGAVRISVKADPQLCWVCHCDHGQKMSTGCFSDPDFPGPTMAMQTRYRHAWCGEFEGARSFEGYPTQVAQGVRRR